MFVGNTTEYIKAENPADAAHAYTVSFPSKHPMVEVCAKPPFQEGYTRLGIFLLKTLKERQQKKKVLQQKEKERQQKNVELFQRLHASVEANEGDLSGLSYPEINALVENMQEFPGLAESLTPEEYAVREKLHKAAFFDRNLQAGLQAQYAKQQAKEAALQTELLNKLNIAVGNKASSGAARGSNAATKAAMLGGAAALMKLNQISEDVNEISEDASEGSEGFEGFGGF